MINTQLAQEKNKNHKHMQTTTNMVTFMKQQLKQQLPEKEKNVRNIFETTFLEEENVWHRFESSIL